MLFSFVNLNFLNFAKMCHSSTLNLFLLSSLLLFFNITDYYNILFTISLQTQKSVMSSLSLLPNYYIVTVIKFNEICSSF